jgi:hypothetical protein
MYMETCAVSVSFDRKHRLRVLRDAYEQAFGELAAATRRLHAVKCRTSDATAVESAREEAEQALSAYHRRRDALADVLRSRPE